MHRTTTQLTSIVRNAIRRPVAKFAFILAAGSALFAVSSANAAPPASYFGRQSSSFAQNLQQQAINTMQQFSNPRFAQTQTRQPVFVSPQAAPTVRAKPFYPAPSNGYHHNGHVLHIHELGFDAVPTHHHGLRIVHVSWHGLANDIGLECGDVIYQINGHSVCSERDVRHAIHHSHHGDVEFVFRDVRTGRTKVRTACLHH